MLLKKDSKVIKIMNEGDIIYTDGHGVKITREKFHVEDKEFYLNGITSIDLQRVPAGNLSSILLFILGFLAIMAGSLKVFSDAGFTVQDSIYVMNSNIVAIGIGVALILAGILRMIMAKDKFAVKIGTAEGEKKPFVTSNREHAAIIVASLKKAYYRKTKDPRSDGKRRLESVVIP